MTVDECARCQARLGRSESLLCNDCNSRILVKARTMVVRRIRAR